MGVVLLLVGVVLLLLVGAMVAIGEVSEGRTSGIAICQSVDRASLNHTHSPHPQLHPLT